MKRTLVRWFLEDTIPFKWIDGHKTEIARYATFSFAVLTLVAQYFPEYAPFITQGQAMLLTLLSLVGVEIGRSHKEAKAKG